MQTMRAARTLELRGPITIDAIPVPTPGAGQVLVRVQACGVCHTDLHAVRGDWRAKPALPCTPGHEGVGVIVQLGPGVTARQIGERVGVPWLHHACGQCEPCQSGWETLCTRQQNTGFSVPGSFAEYVVAHADFTVPIPAELTSHAAAPILCAGLSALKAIRETELVAGQWLVILGIGGVGHLAIQYARALGLKTVAIDVQPHALLLARESGSEIVFDGRGPALAKMVRQATDGGGHGVLVTSSSAAAITQGVELMRRHGTMVLVGLPPGDFTLPTFEVVVKRLTIRGSIGGTRAELREALALAASGQVVARTEMHPLEAVGGVFKRLERGEIMGRAVLTLP